MQKSAIHENPQPPTSVSLLYYIGLQQTTDSRLAEVDDEIQNILKTYNAVGLSIAILEKDQVIYSKDFGFRDYKIPDGT